MKPISISLPQGVNLTSLPTGSQLNATLLTNQVRSAQAQAAAMQQQLAMSGASSTGASNVSIVVSSAEQLNSLVQGAHVINLQNLSNANASSMQHHAHAQQQQHNNSVMRSSKLHVNSINNANNNRLQAMHNSVKNNSSDHHDVTMLNMNDRHDFGVQQQSRSGSMTTPIVIQDSPAKPLQLTSSLAHPNHAMTLAESAAAQTFLNDVDNSGFSAVTSASLMKQQRPIAAGSSLLLNNLAKVRFTSVTTRDVTCFSTKIFPCLT